MIGFIWSRIVTFTALLGLVPFLVGLVLTLMPNLSPLDTIIFERAMLGYGALILGFLGGVRWGLRLQGGAGTDLVFVMGVIGSIAGFFVLLMPYSIGLFILTIGFGLQGLWDVRSAGVPMMYARMRAMMTLLVCVTLLATLIAHLIMG